MIKRFVLAGIAIILCLMTVIPVSAESSVETYKIDNNKKYVGVYMENPDDAWKFEDCINTMAWFADFDTFSEDKTEICLDQHRYTAFITLQPYDMDMKELAAGAYDDKIIKYLSQFSEGDRVNTELFIRFAHEFEMRPKYKTSWYPWQSSDYETYIAAWRHVVDLGHQYAPNIKWVWSPNRADKYTPPYYPGDEYVDYVSISMNNFKNQYKKFRTFYEWVGKRSYLEKYNKPIIFGEVAEHSNNHKQKKKYLESIVNFVAEYDKAIGFVVLNDNVINGDGEVRNFRFSDDDEIRKAFKLRIRKTMLDENA